MTQNKKLAAIASVSDQDADPELEDDEILEDISENILVTNPEGPVAEDDEVMKLVEALNRQQSRNASLIDRNGKIVVEC